VSEYEQAAAWVDAVWGERQGYFCWALGVSGHFNANGKYDFDKWLPRDGGRWPDDRDRFLAEALELSAESDVYVAPYLRSNASRKKGSALASSWLYADLDQVPTGQLKTPGGVLVLGPSGLLVGSGQGRHVYPRLPDELEPAELEQLNRHLARALDADAGWAENKVLRLPGTWNHKERARGGRSAPVALLDFRPAAKDWPAHELVHLLGDPPPHEASSNGLAEIAPAMPSHVPPQLAIRVAEEPAGDRSKQSYTFVAACLEAGLTDAEALALALVHRPTQDKYGSRARGEIERLIGKLQEDAKRCVRPLTHVTQVPHIARPQGEREGVPELGARRNRTQVRLAPLPLGVGENAEAALGPNAGTDSEGQPERPFALPIREFIALPREHKEPMLANAEGRAVVGFRSLTLLGALGGHGKTTWALDLFLHMAAGIDYPPFTIPRPVSTLVIENEGAQELFAEKLEARLQHFPHELKARLDVCTFDWGGFSLATDAHLERLIREIADRGYDLVFGDPLDSLGITGVGSPEDTRKFLALMKLAGLNKTVAWWLNTHPRKEETREALNEIAGAWGGKPDTVFLLRMLEDDRTQLRQPKLRWARRGKGPTLLYAFDPDTEAFSYIGEQAEDERDYVAEIRELLADGRWRTVKEIGIAAHAGEKAVKRELAEHPELFELRTGDEAVALGRRADATLWQLAGVHEEPPQSTLDAEGADE
jgi:hypothetical protein